MAISSCVMLACAIERASAKSADPASRRPTQEISRSDTARIATVAFTTSTYGINTAGTVYRMDDVPLPLRPAIDSPYKSDYDVLKAIEKRIRAKQLGLADSQ